MVERSLRVSPSSDTKMWSVIISIKHDTNKSIIFFVWNRENKGKKGMQKKKDHDGDDRIVTATSGDLVILVTMSL